MCLALAATAASAAVGAIVAPHAPVVGALALVGLLGAAAGPLLAAAPGPVAAVKLLLLALAGGPAVGAGLGLAARAALPEAAPATVRATALGVAALLALVGLRGRIAWSTPGRALLAVHLLALLAGAGAAAVWLGAGPNFGGLGPHVWGTPRFALVAAAERALVPLSPWQAGEALPVPPVLAMLRAALAELVGAGPLALAAGEAAWAVGVVLLTAGHLAAAVFRRGLATLAASVVGVAAPAGVALVFDPTSTRLSAALALLDRTSVLALAAVAALAHLHGDPARAGTAPWRVLAALCLGLAFLIDPWLGGGALATAALAAATGPGAVVRLLPLALAALPGASVVVAALPPRSVEPGGFVENGAWLVAALVLVPLTARGRSDGARVRELARLVAAATAVAAVASSWAGGAPARALLELLAGLGAVSACGALASRVDRSRAGLAAALLLVALAASAGSAAVPTAARAFELARGAGPFLDGADGRLELHRDDPAEVAAAFASRPGPDVYDPHWREPTHVEGLEAGDFAALWSHLARHAPLRAARPVLVVDVARPGVRHAGGVRLSDAGRPHEAAALAALDLFVDRVHPAWRGTPGEHEARVLAATSLFGEEPPGRATRARFEALGRPVLIPIGPAQRAAVRASARVDVERRLFEFGCAELARFGEVALFVWPAGRVDDLR